MSGRRSSRSRSSHSCTAAAALLLGFAPLVGAEPGAGFSTRTTLTIEETYDSNVFLQSTTALADRASWVTSVAPTFTLAWHGANNASSTLGYAPSWTRFHSEGSEDFVAHRLNAASQGRLFGAAGQFQAGASFIDGSDESPVWTGAGGPPAAGAPTVRDRRDQAVYRASGSLAWKIGSWFVKPVGTAYVADFQTVHRASTGCQNYVDRNDLNAGLDAGREIRPGLNAALGYRIGMQDQAALLAYPEEYDNTYHRILAGISGRLASWATVALTAGPEFRHYADTVHAAMTDRHRTVLFVDCTATITMTDRDTLSFVARQFEQLSMSGRGAYTDLTLDAGWRHKLNKSTTLAAGARAYRTEFIRPALRDDWILSERVSCALALTDTWSLDGSIAHEDGISRIDGTSGREYARTAASIAARRTF